MGNLSSMGKIFDNYICWDEELQVIKRQEAFLLKYADPEDAWLYNQFDYINEAFRKIHMGPECMKEYIMFSYDVPLSKRFPEVCLRVR